MSKIISIANHKGGVGKTTTTAALGGILSMKGEKVLMVDMDPQANLTKTFLDNSNDESFYSAFESFRKKRKGLLPVISVRDNLDLVPGNISLSNLDTDFASVFGKESILKRLLEPFTGIYDYILIDCPAQLGVITTNAFMAADYVLVPMTCDAYSTDGLQEMISFVELIREGNPSLMVLGIVITKYRRTRYVDKTVAEMLDEQGSDLVMQTRIRENTAVVRAPFYKKDIYSYKNDSIGAIDYVRLSEEIEQRISKL